MQTHEIWIEGWLATCESNLAMKIGEATGDSFANAAESLIKAKGWDMRRFDRERGTYWGCRLFNNEADAMKAFG